MRGVQSIIKGKCDIHETKRNSNHSGTPMLHYDQRSWLKSASLVTHVVNQ